MVKELIKVGKANEVLVAADEIKNEDERSRTIFAVIDTLAKANVVNDGLLTAARGIKNDYYMSIG